MWSDSTLPDYYETHRQSTADLYPSEQFFFKDLLVEGSSILDIGCALGGLALIVTECLREFSYTGVDISHEMISRATARFPQHRFVWVPESDLAVLDGEQFDLVFCLGVLHLTRRWRDLVGAAWRHTRRGLLFDLRETYVPTLEDEGRSCFVVEPASRSGARAKMTLPYNMINTADALQTVMERCPHAGKLARYSYLSEVSKAAKTPVTHAFMTTYCIER